MKDARYQLGFIGAGKLAGSVIRGLLLKNFCDAGSIIASEPNDEARAALSQLKIVLTAENSEVAEKAGIIFIGVKPDGVVPVLRELGDPARDKLIVSFAAGIRIADMERATNARVMRVMTNTPSAIGQAATAFARGSRTSENDSARLREIFSAIGLVVEVDDEQIDGVTALAGSGPAFVYTMIEALAQGGETSGLGKDAALKLAAQTALGAAELVMTTGKSPAELRKMVVTPGGTTAAGLATMEKHGTAAGITAAVEAAAARGREMARRD